jgi:hypothetical protein
MLTWESRSSKSLEQEGAHNQLPALCTEQCRTVWAAGANMGAVDRMPDELLASNCQAQDWRAPYDCLTLKSETSTTAGIERAGIE